MPEHKDIVDPNIHETKGMQAATNGQVHAKSGGVGAWVTPYSLDTVRQTVVFEGSTLTDQLPAAADTPQNVTFGGVVAGTDVSMDSGGTVTINTSSFYQFKFNLNFGRTGSTSTAIVFARLVINGTPTGFVQGVKIPDAVTSLPVQIDFEREFTAGDLVKVEIIRDSAGAADGGLVGINPTLAGWNDTPSAWLRISKLEGITA